MKNPFATQPGFGLRVHYATNAIKSFGCNPLSTTAYDGVFNNRKFDNCFENHDGQAVIYAIMKNIHEKNDHLLLKGVKAIDSTVVDRWNVYYHQEKAKQLSLF